MKVIIVEDQMLFREGLAAILRSESDLEVIGLLGTAGEAIENVCRLNPDIVIMGYILPDGTGANAARQILKKCPQCKIIILTTYEDDNDNKMMDAIRSGVKGYLLKSIPPTKLLAAIRGVYNGEGALSRSMTRRLMEELSKTKWTEDLKDDFLLKLSQRERDVLRAIGQGMTNQEIASHLFIAANTVRFHVHSILEKLNLPDRKAAAWLAQHCELTR